MQIAAQYALIKIKCPLAVKKDKKEQQFIWEREKSGIKKFLEEFKAFAMRGNVLDMAVGVVIGGAFTAIVTALVENIINPLISLFFKADFSDCHHNKTLPAGRSLCACGREGFAHFAVWLWKSGVGSEVGKIRGSYLLAY